MVLQVAKIISPSFMFHHFTINWIWLMLFLHQLKHILVLVKQLTVVSSTETFSQADTTHVVHHFPIQLFANGGI